MPNSTEKNQFLGYEKKRLKVWYPMAIFLKAYGGSTPVYQIPKKY